MRKNARGVSAAQWRVSLSAKLLTVVDVCLARGVQLPRAAPTRSSALLLASRSSCAAGVFLRANILVDWWTAWRRARCRGQATWRRWTPVVGARG